jgi:methylthioribose-1-phosphate isomerase
MKIGGQHYRTIFLDDDGWSVRVIDQTRLPFEFRLLRLTELDEAAEAITSMIVRGAPLIGATGAYAIALAMRRDPSDARLASAVELLAATRPTAINLRWALARMTRVLQPLPSAERAARAYAEASAIAEEDVAWCAAIGRHGAALIRGIAARKATGPVNVLTHCNAGWLACVDWGTALAPIYGAHDQGIPIHVYVDETRPRNQGAALTAYELGAHGVPHSVVVDNAGGHLMQRGHVDLCIVGSDRVTATGDVANKIGTYLKALASHDNAVPFYVAFPFSTIDWSVSDGIGQIPIEERAAREVTHMTGMTDDGSLVTARVIAPGSSVLNPAFDVTPARLVTGFITERGIAPASRAGLESLYPERASACR